MKVSLKLLVVLAIANAGLVQKFPLKYGGKRTIMNIMVEVENKIKSHSPLDKIKGVLDKFKSAVSQEQGIHDEVYTAQQAECQSEIAYRRAEVDDALGTLKIANGILKTSNILLKKTQATLEKLKIFLILKEDTQSYNRGAVTFNDAINAIDDAIDLGVVLVKGEACLIQVADMATKLMLASVATKMNKAFFMVPLAALASIKQEKDAACAAERLVQLLLTLRNNVEEAWASNTAENNNAIALFTQQKDLYLATQDRLESSKQQLVSLNPQNNNWLVKPKTYIEQQQSKQLLHKLLLTRSQETKSYGMMQKIYAINMKQLQKEEDKN